MSAQEPRSTDIETSPAPGLFAADATGASLLAIPVSVVLGSYLLDLAGIRFTPSIMLLVAVASALGTAWWLWPSERAERGGLVLLALSSAPMFAWLLWIARPALLPLSTGPDLTHHLILIRYLEEHWRLVHDPAVERFLGEMAQYTPGSHVLVALAGAWSATDGLRAFHPVQAAAVALEAGLLLLVCLRLLPAKAPRALALIGVLLLLASPRYFLGGFTEYGFFAQVIAQLFVVGMWWALVAWDDRPDVRLCLVFGFAGAATFLTWPVYTGPPALALFVVIACRRDLRVASRLRHLLAAFVPLAAFSAAYLIGRLGWLQLAGTGGAAPSPSVASYGSLLAGLAVAGFGIAVARRRGRPTAIFILAVLAQSAAFYLLAKRSGAPQPYMALKMFYLLLWPMAACGVMAVGEAWSLLPAALRRHRGYERIAVWALVTLVLVAVSRPLLRNPSRLHPLPPAVSLPLYEAGKWARANVSPACVEYLVGDDETAYWLHLAVLGNPRMWNRTGDNSTYEPNDAVLRWLTPNGLPYAIADLPVLARDVRDELDVVKQFGPAAVVRRRGPSTCDEHP